MAKTLNALIYPSAPTVIADRRMIDVATIPSHKASWWRPIVIIGNDSFNSLTHKKTGPVTTIEEAQVVDTYTISSLDAGEIAAAKAAAVNSINGMYKPLLKILFNHENRLRAQASPPGSALADLDAFKTYAETLL